MSETPKEKNQAFSDYISLIKKIEKIVVETPDTQKEDKLEKDISIEGFDKSLEPIIKPHQDITEVEQHTSKLEKSISAVAEETGITIEQKKIEDIIRVEKEIIELYSGIKIQLSDFYFKETSKQEKEIIDSIKSKLPLIDKISLKKGETYGLPFALCKLEGKYQAIIPIEIGDIKLPTLMVGVNKNLKLLLISDEEIFELTPNEKKLWDQAFNRFQLKLTQLISSNARENLSKESSKMKLMKIDSSKIHHYIREYQEKQQNLLNYQKEILDHLNEIKDLITTEKSFWKNDEEFSKAKKELKKQLLEFEERQKKISREAQIDFIKLKRTQRQLDAKTKKFKLDEKRKKKIPREEKEELINEVREFQKSKLQLLENIEHTKKMEDTLRKWFDILSNNDMKQTNETLLENFYQDLVNKLQNFIDNQNIESILEDTILTDSEVTEIVIHVIYIPTTLYSFKAKQGEENIEGKAVFLAPTQEVILLNPSTV